MYWAYSVAILLYSLRICHVVVAAAAVDYSHPLWMTVEIVFAEIVAAAPVNVDVNVAGILFEIHPLDSLLTSSEISAPVSTVSHSKLCQENGHLY